MENYEENYVNKELYLIELKDRLDFLKDEWAGVNFYIATQNLYSNPDFVRVLNDDFCFSALIKMGRHPYLCAYIQNIVFSDFYLKLLPYPDLKASIHLYSKVHTQEMYDSVFGFTLEKYYTFASDSKKTLLVPNPSFYFSKTSSAFKLPWYRIIAETIFDFDGIELLDKSLMEYLRIWSIVFDFKLKNKVADWFESHRSAKVSIFSVHYVTEFFQKFENDTVKRELLEDTPMEWLEQLD